MNIARIMSKVINRPLMLEPGAAKVVYSVLANKADASPLLTEWQTPTPNANRLLSGKLEEKRGFYRVSGDTGIISVVGELANRGSYVGASSGIVTYEGITAQLHAAAKDPEVSKILLDVESPGGEAVGAMELASTVRKINAEKPVYAFVNGMAASAGYALVSGASRIYTVPSGIVGSIGVVLLHVDYSAQLAEDGVKPTLIHAGAHKVDGNPFEPLSESVKADLQAEVMQFYDLFVETVAAGRKKLSAKAIRATEARTYIGQSAVDAGLADAVATFEDMMSEINRAPAGRSTVRTKGNSMSDEQGAPAATNAGPTAEQQVQAAVAAHNQRMTAVLTHADIQGNAERTAAASDLLSTSQMTSEQIVTFVTKNVQSKSSVPSIAERTASDAIDTKPKASTPNYKNLNANSVLARRAKERGAWDTSALQ